MVIVWTSKARRDLEDAHAYIARDDLSRATETVQKIVVAINRLTDFPSMGRPGRKSGTRELVVPRLPYRVQNDEVVIVRILHTSRRWT